jgi:hypothetical protein
MNATTKQLISEYKLGNLGVTQTYLLFEELVNDKSIWNMSSAWWSLAIDYMQWTDIPIPDYLDGCFNEQYHSVTGLRPHYDKIAEVTGCDYRDVMYNRREEM